MYWLDQTTAVRATSWRRSCSFSVPWEEELGNSSTGRVGDRKSSSMAPGPRPRSTRQVCLTETEVQNGLTRFTLDRNLTASLLPANEPGSSRAQLGGTIIGSLPLT